MEGVHQEQQYLSRLLVEGQETLILQKLILEDLKVIEEWNDLKMQSLFQIELQVLEIEELADKKPGEVLVLQQVVKHQVVEETETLIPPNLHLQG